MAGIPVFVFGFSRSNYIALNDGCRHFRSFRRWDNLNKTGIQRRSSRAGTQSNRPVEGLVKQLAINSNRKATVRLNHRCYEPNEPLLQECKVPLLFPDD